MQNLLVDVGALKGNDHRVLRRKTSMDNIGSRSLGPGELRLNEDDDSD